jgi:hypothetical protein
MSRHSRATLYVPLVDPSGMAQRAGAQLDRVAPQLGRLGIAVEVCRIRPCDIRNPRVLAALRRRGITSLPALLAEGRAHVGLNAIGAYYDALAAPPPARRRDGPRDADTSREYSDGGADSADARLDDDASADLEEFMMREMRMTRLGGEIEND